ncbi:MAG: hypothetical protein DRJ42_02130 [Deltaproteobacteria bacterium]|nr:MAG: hypothetical protein DRJ42_02130 [Deltaproteobacteria bacterium]
MYRFIHKPDHHLFVCALYGGGKPAEDFATHFRELRKAGLAAGQNRLTVVVLLRPGHPLPPPSARSEVAALMSSGDVLADIAVISTNPVVRGVLTAVSWVKSGDMVTFRMFPTWAHASPWLEERRGGPLGPADQLITELMHKPAMSA